MVEPPFYTR